MAEPADDEPCPVHETGVGGEDEVGQSGDRRHLLDLGAGRLEVGDHVVPLGVGPVDVDVDLLVHPGIDLVQHAEMVRRAHQVPVAPGQGQGQSRGVSHG
jgi:hypothetical protein